MEREEREHGVAFCRSRLLERPFASLAFGVFDGDFPSCLPTFIPYRFIRVFISRSPLRLSASLSCIHVQHKDRRTASTSTPNIPSPLFSPRLVFLS